VAAAALAPGGSHVAAADAAGHLRLFALTPPSAASAGLPTVKRVQLAALPRGVVPSALAFYCSRGGDVSSRGGGAAVAVTLFCATADGRLLAFDAHSGQLTAEVHPCAQRLQVHLFGARRMLV
jgi:hypothetical protein